LKPLIRAGMFQFGANLENIVPATVIDFLFITPFI